MTFFYNESHRFVQMKLDFHFVFYFILKLSIIFLVKILRESPPLK